MTPFSISSAMRKKMTILRKPLLEDLLEDPLEGRADQVAGQEDGFSRMPSRNPISMM
jgi:hypothetical protein